MRKRGRAGGTEESAQLLLKACDNCRCRKFKCNDSIQCDGCRKDNVKCTNSGQTRESMLRQLSVSSQPLSPTPQDDLPCSICKEFDEDPYPILLCDTKGCNGQHHTRCVGLDNVPAGGWFCNNCLERANAEEELLMNLFPPLGFDATNEELDSPDEMQKDSQAARIWSLYRKIKKQTPSQKCSENLTGRIIKWAIRLSNQNNELKEENNRLREDYDDLKEEYDDLDEENAELNNWKKGREQRLDDAQDVHRKNDDLKQQNADLKRQYAYLHKAYLKRQKAYLKQRKSDLKRQNADLKRQNVDLNEWNNGREQWIDHVENVERENAGLNEWNNGREQWIDVVENVERENADLNEWNNDREQRIDDVENVERPNADLKRQLSGEYSLFISTQQHIITASGLAISSTSNPMTGMQVIYPSSPLGPSSNCSNFRPSIYELKSAFKHAEVCQTATFKNSHYNTAHYNNPDFQPEEWNPESE